MHYHAGAVNVFEEVNKELSKSNLADVVNLYF